MLTPSEITVIVECALSTTRLDSEAFQSKVGRVLEALFPGDSQANASAAIAAIRAYHSCGLAALPARPADFMALVSEIGASNSAKAGEWSRSVLERSAGLRSPAWRSITRALEQLSAADTPGPESPMALSLDLAEAVTTDPSPDVEDALLDEDEDEELELGEPLELLDLDDEDADDDDLPTDAIAEAARRLGEEFGLALRANDDLGLEESDSVLDLCDELMADPGNAGAPPEH